MGVSSNCKVVVGRRRNTDDAEFAKPSFGAQIVRTGLTPYPA